MTGAGDFVHLLSALPVAVVRIVDGRITFANEEAARIFGESSGALVGRPFLDFVDPAERELVGGRHVQRLRGARAPERYVVTHVRPDGLRRRVEVEPRTIGPNETVTVLRDVTDVVHEGALVVALTELAAHVQAARSVEDVFAVAGQGLVARGLSSYGIRVDGDDLVIETVSLHPVTGGSLDQALGRSLAGVRFPALAVSGLATALSTRQSHYYEDLGPTAAEFLAHFGISPAARFVGDTDRLLFAPIFVRDHPWGVLAVTSPTLSADDAAALTLFAAQISSTLEVLASLADLERTNRDVAAIHAVARTSGDPDLGSHLPRLAEIAATASSSDVATLMLLDEAHDDLRVVAAHGFPGELPENVRTLARSSSMTGTVAASGVPVAFTRAELPEGLAREFMSAQGLEHALILPLYIQARLVGVVSLARRGARPYRPEDIDAATLLSSQLAVQVENARLVTDAQRRVEELQVLLDIGRVITASLDLDQILEQAAGMLARFVDASNCYIMLLDPARPVLSGAACSNDERRAEFRGTHIRLGEPSIASHAVSTRGLVTVRDVTKSDHVNQPLVRRYGSKSLLALPLMVRDEPIGCVVLDDVVRIRDWNAAEIQRATLMANQLGVAVANARLYEDLKQSYGHLARAQEELVKRERLAALGELAAVVAHEVRNPVAVIFNALSALRKILKLTGDAAMLLGIVGEEADRLNRIVGDLLDFARPSEPALAPESLETVIRDTVEAAASEPAALPVQILTELGDHLPDVRIDARMVRQALLNVVINGLQAMPRGGVLTVVAAADVSNGKRWARVDVLDTGPGVPPEALTRIFQPFFTTKATGTGLGLAVVKRIMEAHRGEVTVETRTGGVGTKVSLLLPMEEEPS